MTEWGTRQAAQGLLPPRDGKGVRPQPEQAVCLGQRACSLADPSWTQTEGTCTSLPSLAHAEPPSSAGGTVPAVQKMATRWHLSLIDEWTSTGGAGAPKREDRAGACQDGEAPWTGQEPSATSPSSGPNRAMKCVRKSSV